VISLRHVKEIDGEPVITVFRLGIGIPLAMLTGIVLVLWITIGPLHPLFALIAWVAGLLPILISRRAAAIFTTNSLLVIQPLGRRLKFPLRDVKSALIDAAGLRVEFVVGKAITLSVPDPHAVAYLLNKAAGKGLVET
jgi:hypothetical protein